MDTARVFVLIFIAKSKSKAKSADKPVAKPKAKPPAKKQGLNDSPKKPKKANPWDTDSDDDLGLSDSDFNDSEVVAARAKVGGRAGKLFTLMHSSFDILVCPLMNM